MDYVHKIVSPSTYSCDLCNLTYGNFSEKEVWRNFRKNTPHTLIFTYKDTFLNEFAKNDYQEYEFPIILEQKEEGFAVLMKAAELNSIHSAEELIEILQDKLA